MNSVNSHSLKSTIGRTHRRLARPLAFHARPRITCLQHCSRALAAVRRRLHDPLGITADMVDWTLDEEEIRADLEYGRD
jgi:hypothetical protein